MAKLLIQCFNYGLRFEQHFGTLGAQFGGRSEDGLGSRLGKYWRLIWRGFEERFGERFGRLSDGQSGGRFEARLETYSAAVSCSQGASAQSMLHI